MNYDKDKYKSVEKLIDDFESDKISATLTVAEINKIGYYPIDRYYLHSYWGSTDKDTFIKSIIIPPIQNWQEINDETAMTLIQEMLEMVAEDSIRFDRIREALEKRYGKIEGTISEYVFQNDILDPKKILKKLKKDTKIYL